MLEQPAVCSVNNSFVYRYIHENFLSTRPFQRLVYEYVFEGTDMLTKAKKKQPCLVACIVSVELDAYGIRKTPNVDVGTTSLCVPVIHENFLST
jgi:hypothetical protein